MDFAALKAGLLAQIGRAPSDLCYTMVTADINQNLRLHHMLKEAELASPFLLPDDFAQVQNVLVDDCVLAPSTEVSIGRSENQNAAEFTVAADKLVLDVAEDTLTLKYYAKHAALENDADTNTVLTANPSIYVYGVLAHHSALIRDTEALSMWKPVYETMMGNAQKEDNKKRMAGSGMIVKARASA